MLRASVDRPEAAHLSRQLIKLCFVRCVDALVLREEAAAARIRSGPGPLLPKNEDVDVIVDQAAESKSLQQLDEFSVLLPVDGR